MTALKIAVSWVSHQNVERELVKWMFFQNVKLAGERLNWNVAFSSYTEAFSYNGFVSWRKKHNVFYYKCGILFLNVQVLSIEKGLKQILIRTLISLVTKWPKRHDLSRVTIFDNSIFASGERFSKGRAIRRNEKKNKQNKTKTIKRIKTNGKVIGWRFSSLFPSQSPSLL